MTTLTQKIEELEKTQKSLINNFRADRSDKKIMEQYKKNRRSNKRAKKRRKFAEPEKKDRQFQRSK